jgi:hypothetical protein
MPGVEAPSLVRVMAFMQGPGLLFLAPLLACFFVGGAWLSVALARARLVWRGTWVGLALADLADRAAARSAS